MRNKYTNIGWAITTIVAILPIILWLLAAPMPWDNLKNTMENLSKLAGLAGMALFAWAVILSARLKIYNKLFLGLDNTYRAHHLIGAWAFILLLIHPVLVTFRYFLSSPASAYEFLKPSLASPFRLLGSIALFGMIVAIFLTMYIKIKHEKFILVQRILGLLLFVGAIHAVFVGNSDLGFTSIGIRSLQIYFMILIGLAAFIYIYRSIFHGNLARYSLYAISSISKNGNIYEIELAPNDKPIKYLPGQFSFIKLEAEGVLSQSHPFSMSSDPRQDKLSFGIKVLGDYTAALAGAQPGTVVKVDGPYGTFSNKIINDSRQIWIAGGIGITPFVSMAKALGNSQKIDLYYCAKNNSEAFYIDKLNKISKTKPNLKIIPFFEDKNGFLTAEYILKNSTDTSNANFMICGPAPMMHSLKRQLKEGGISSRKINTEEFNLS